MAEISEKLRLWQDRYRHHAAKYQNERDKMDEREDLYKGKRKLKRITEADREGGKYASHVHNICMENIEAEVDSNIPQPKVTARRQVDEDKARLIENYLRNQIDRLNTEMMNDLQERTVPIQGGSFWLIEWDNAQVSPGAVGEVTLSTIHPKQFVPQDGVYTDIEDMDFFFLRFPETKAYIKSRYGVDVSDEDESEPENKSGDNEDSAEDIVTLYKAYYRNDKGGIGLFAWVNNTIVEDLDDCQVRRLKRCKQCGAPKTLIPVDEIDQFPKIKKEKDERKAAVIQMAKQISEAFEAGTEEFNDPFQDVPLDTVYPEKKPDACPYCGCEEWEDSDEEYEERLLPHTLADGTEIPGASPALNEQGEAYMQPTLIPFYKPDRYPVILQRNVSLFGQLLGSSDIDAIADCQNTLNRLDKKINDRILKAGTRITLPDRADLRVDPEDSEIWYIGNASDKALIGAYDFKGDLEYELYWRNSVYNQARQMLGLTDSYQGREDTATSGKARQIAAQQAAGRMESKRIMKYSAWSQIYELIFKFSLAYQDEPRPVLYTAEDGSKAYDWFDRDMFLECDEDGNWYYDDQFIFSCDSSSGLATNRESMWQELTQHYATGAFGQPGDLNSLKLYWRLMEEQHYPGAGVVLNGIEEQIQQAQQQQAMMAQQQAMAAQQQAAAQGVPQGVPAR